MLSQSTFRSLRNQACLDTTRFGEAYGLIRCYYILLLLLLLIVIVVVVAAAVVRFCYN